MFTSVQCSCDRVVRGIVRGDVLGLPAVPWVQRPIVEDYASLVLGAQMARLVLSTRAASSETSLVQDIDQLGSLIPLGWHTKCFSVYVGSL